MSPTSTPIPDAAASGVGCAERQRAPQPALSRAACLARLAVGGHGRVAATMKAVPVIIPVSFTLVDDDVILRADFDEGIAKALADSVVAFETDQVGAEGRLAWSVHAIGIARRIPQRPTGLEGHQPGPAGPEGHQHGPTGPEGHQPGPAGPGFRLRPEVLTGWEAAPEAVT